MSRDSHHRKIISKTTILESAIIAFALTTFFGIRMVLADDPNFGWQIGLAAFIFTFTVALLITAQDHAFINWLQVKLPWQKDNVKRILIEFIVTSIGAAIIITVIFLAFLWLYGKQLKDAPLEANIWDHIGIAILINLVMLGINETDFLVRQWKKTIVQQEQLRREHAEAQYQALNNQVNPHFLFNSLNTLASIIPQSQEQSLEFVQRFSAVYRYVLDSGEKTVVDVAEEIHFIHSYIYLHQARHSHNLKVDMDIDASKLKKLIPPLSLQILIENALKHNEISDSNPLHIKIFNKNNHIHIENNYQPRKQQQPDSGIGLKNLKNRYSYLTTEEPQINVKGSKFIAVIPLIDEDE